MVKIICFSFIISFATFSCSSLGESVNNGKGQCNVLKKMVIDTLNLILDDSTSIHTTMSQYYDGYYTFTTFGKNKRLLIYNLRTGHVENLLNINNVTNSSISGYYIHNLDSIFLFSYSENAITLIDIRNKILNSWKLPPFRRNYIMSPRVNTNRPMLLENGILYLGGIASGEPNPEQKIFTVLNIGTGEVQTKFEYPDIYKKYNWGGLYYRYVYFTKDLDDNFLISFPACHNVYSTSDFVSSLSSYAGSCKIKQIYSHSGVITKSSRLKHYQTNYSYKSIITDPYRQIYYRVYEKPITYTERLPWYKPCGIVVLNKDFEYIGEFQLNIDNLARTWLYTTFVSPDGLNVQLNSDINEKYMSFAVLKIEGI